MADSKRDIDVVISGYYGYKNSGDEALLKATISDLKKLIPKINIVVLSATPRLTGRLHEVSSIHRFNLIKIFFILRRTKLLISGGGSLMQDVTSTKSIIYYLTIIRLALYNKAKVMLYANGIGPIFYRKNRAKVYSVVNRVDCITLRDEISRDELVKLGIDEQRIIITADPAYTLDASPELRVTDILKQEGLAPNKSYFVVSVRNWKYLKKNFIDEVVSACEYIYNKYSLIPVFLPMQKNTDTDILRRIMFKMSGKSVMIKDNYDVEDVLGIVKYSKFIIGMRLHTLIYASKTAAPLIGISYDPKIEGFMDFVGQKFHLDVSDVSADKITGFVDTIMANRDVYVNELAAGSRDAVIKAHETAKIAFSYIEQEVL